MTTSELYAKNLQEYQVWRKDFSKRVVFGTCFILLGLAAMIVAKAVGYL
jgi:hypothetical protein